MSVPSMVHRSGDTLIVRSVVSGDALFGSADDAAAATDVVAHDHQPQQQQSINNKRKLQQLQLQQASATYNNGSCDDKDLPECKVKRNYSCNNCDFFTQNPRHYLYHLRDVHEEKVRIYECPNCLYASKHFQKLLRHTKMVHGTGTDGLMDEADIRMKTRKRATAPPVVQPAVVDEDDDPSPPPPPPPTNIDCGDEYDDEEATPHHVSVFKCSVCAFTTRNRPQLIRHEREEHIKTKFFRCLKCTYVTHMKARFTKHVKYHSMPMIKCDMCDFRTPYKWNLDRHCKNHNGRGAFRCSACNFTADIKQSLTVHEMNHHVPPVGQAAGLGVGRRRNKVGASDATAAEDAAAINNNNNNHQYHEENLNHHHHHQQQVAAGKTEFESTDRSNSSNNKRSSSKIETIATTTTKKSKQQDQQQSTAISHTFGSDFINPDDIIHHANGKVYIKNKCKLCNYKSAWSGEMAKHEKKAHNIVREETSSSSSSTPKTTTSTKKSSASRPIPNLIPIPQSTSSLQSNHHHSKISKKLLQESVVTAEPTVESIMSQQDFNEICAKSANSALKDFASLFGSEDVFKNIPNNNESSATAMPSNNLKMPDLIPAGIYAASSSSLATLPPPKTSINNNNNLLLLKDNDQFKQKNASFFDKLKEKLMTGQNGDNCNLICNYCGYESKCLTEQAKHQKVCGTADNNNHLLLLHTLTPTHNVLSSSRCQYCRQRCKSSTDLYIHLQTCSEASSKLLSLHHQDQDQDEEDNKSSVSLGNIKEHRYQHDMVESSEEGELKIDESQSDDGETKPHPMENRVFVWNNIEVPMDIEIDESNYEYTDDKIDDNVSLDLSIRTQSPSGLSDNSSYIGHDYSSSNTMHQHPHHHHHHNNTSATSSITTDKIPTHGNDISIAQHKRVFKCPNCSFWASTASRFHVHIVGHLNKKPFECSLCAYRSNWRWDITKHIKLKSVRDPAHERAKVLMTDETGRRNYTKYNKYLTEIHVTSGQSMDTSGGSGTRPRHHDHHRINSPNNNSSNQGGNNNNINNNNNNNSTNGKADLPKLTRAPNGRDFSPLLKRPPPPLKAADGAFFAKVSSEKKQRNNNSNNNTESKRTLFKCKKCNFRDASREVLLAHVKGHYQQNNGSGGGGVGGSSSNTSDLDLKGSSPEKDEASVNMLAKGSQAPFRCGHCNQVSNWKHVIQRHCRLKHSGDIRVVSNKNGQEKLEVDEQMDEPDHVDVPQEGTFKCNSCPFSNNDHLDFENHLNGHLPGADSIMKCHYCKYFVSHKDDLVDHLKLHGIIDPDDFLNRMVDRNNMNAGSGDAGETGIAINSGKRFKCLTCPYVTNSKSQYTYHKQFHKPRGGQYTCTQCSYNVSKRHLLHQHLKVHGISTTPQKQNGDVIDLDEMSEEIIEEVTATSINNNQQQSFDAQHFVDIPLVWVSKNGKFSKMFKCRFCPHVNLRKVNIQEHEKMHSVREKNPNSTRLNDVEHRCTECNYICNNAGVLSSHSKVHQGLYGTVHCLVDPVKSDEEQIRELSKFLNPSMMNNSSSSVADAIENLPSVDDNDDDDYENAETAMNNNIDDHNEMIMNDNNSSVLYFCNECPARFLKENEFTIHSKLHGVRLFYKCDYCSYSARQKPHLLAHNKVHTSDYQDRTRILQTMYITSNIYSQPQIYPIKGKKNELVWIIFVENNSNSTNNNKFNDNNNLLGTILMKSSKSSINNVPISGTELYQQKSEAQAAEKAAQLLTSTVIKVELPPKPADPQFGTLMHGNPEFIYPTYLKNGRQKEKRYKCHKCPSAFEKREQYKVHLSLHGSKQRYKCEECDYSVKYYANYVQHLKKHKLNTDATRDQVLSVKSTDDDNMMINDVVDDDDQTAIMNDDNRIPALDLIDDDNNKNSSFMKLSVSDQQAYKILQQRMDIVSNKDTTTSISTSDVIVAAVNSEKKLFWCPSCPYTNHRKDAVDNHQRRHINISGTKSHHTCEHCDYSVPQVHFLRDHTKLHFSQSKVHQIDGYMSCDNLKLISSNSTNDDDDVIVAVDNLNTDNATAAAATAVAITNDKCIIFEENGSKIEDKQFLPPLSADISERFNNNDGEKQFVNLETGELVNKILCENNSDNKSFDNKDNKMEES